MNETVPKLLILVGVTGSRAIFRLGNSRELSIQTHQEQRLQNTVLYSGDFSRPYREALDALVLVHF